MYTAINSYSGRVFIDGKKIDECYGFSVTKSNSVQEIEIYCVLTEEIYKFCCSSVGDKCGPILTKKFKLDLLYSKSKDFGYHDVVAYFRHSKEKTVIGNTVNEEDNKGCVVCTLFFECDYLPELDWSKFNG